MWNSSEISSLNTLKAYPYITPQTFKNATNWTIIITPFLYPHEPDPYMETLLNNATINQTLNHKSCNFNVKFQIWLKSQSKEQRMTKHETVASLEHRTSERSPAIQIWYWQIIEYIVTECTAVLTVLSTCIHEFFLSQH